MNTTDPRLHELFEAQSQGVRVAVGDLAERAIARDRRHRRREVAGAALAGVLALAIAVPLGWNAFGPSRASQVPAGTNPPAVSTSTAPSPSQSIASPTPTPTQTPTITATAGDGSVVARPTAGPVVASSPVPYVVGGVLQDGGRTVSLPKVGTVTFVARVADGGILVGGQVDFQPVLFVLDSAGAELKRLPEVSTAFVSQDRTHFLASNASGDLGYYDAKGALINSLAAATCNCSSDGAGGYQAAGLIGTTAYAAKRTNAPGSVAWDVTGASTTAIEGEVVLVNAARGLAVVRPAGLTETQQKCQELWDLGTLRPRWRLCHPLMISSFSWDGSYLLAYGHVDGLGDEWLNKDGTFRFEPLVVLRTDDAAVVMQATAAQSFAMDDLSGKVTVQHGDGKGSSALSSCSLDGECEVVAPATKPTPGPYDPSDLPPYVLSTN